MRRRRPERRQIHPDPVYKDLLVAKFVNNLMMDGKKSIAFGIFYDAIQVIEEKIEENKIRIKIRKRIKIIRITQIMETMADNILMKT